MKNEKRLKKKENDRDKCGEEDVERKTIVRKTNGRLRSLLF